MTDAPSMNPVSAALSFILSGNTGIHIFDYAESKMFAGLWFNGLETTTPDIAGHQIDWNDKNTSVLIVGEDPPDKVFTRLLPCLKGINFRDHLTATSWMAAWRLKFPDAKARVVVLASRAEEISSSIAQAISTIISSRSANDAPLVPGVSLLRSPSLEDLGCTLQVTSSLGAKPSAAVQSMLRATLWDGLTSDREGHHAVSNVLGALLLSSQVGRGKTHPGEPWAQDYLLALVQACGVGASTNQVTLKEHQGVQCWLSPELQKEIGAAVFIDDMADIWEFFLRGALGFVGDRKFPGTDHTLRESFVTSPRTKFYDEIQGLPERLKSVLGSGSTVLSAGALISGEHRIEKDFVLFLDLRLFPKRGSTDGDIQVPFFKQLAEFGFSLLDSGRNLPWLDDDGKKLLRKELEQFAGSTSSQSFTGSTPTLPPEETLLPRLLSLLDPTLPIIIFSSTHRTDLIEPFRNYGNIITTFRKPILTGMTRNWAEVVKELHADFTSALDQATRILRVRRASLSVSALLAANPHPEMKEELPLQAVEIFIDESFLERDQVYAVGAVVVIAQKHGDIRQFCKRLEEQDLSWGLSLNNLSRFVNEARSPWQDGKRLVCNRRWSLKTPSGPDTFLSKTATPEACKSATSQIQRTAVECGVRVFAAVLACDSRKHATKELDITPLQGSSLTQTDELHRDLTVRLLQTLVLTHPEIRAALRQPNASIALDVGARTAVPQDYDRNYEDLYQRFGFRFTDQELTSMTQQERCDLWNRVLERARKQHWWQHGDVTVSLNANGEMQPDEATLQQWAGCFIWNPRRKMISVSSSDGFYFLRESLSVLRAETTPKVVRARGVALFDFSATNDWLTKLYSYPCFPYQVHYLADWAARSGAIQVAHQRPMQDNPLKDLFSDGFVDEWNLEKLRLLKATIRIEQGDVSSGMHDVMLWLDTFPNPRHSEIIRLLLIKVGNAFKNIDGSALLNLYRTASTAKGIAGLNHEAISPT